MYYLIGFVLLAIIISKPDEVSNSMPGMTDDERAQLKNGLTAISQGVSDTASVGINALLRNILKR